MTFSEDLDNLLAGTRLHSALFTRTRINRNGHYLTLMVFVGALPLCHQGMVPALRIEYLLETSRYTLLIKRLSITGLWTRYYEFHIKIQETIDLTYHIPNDPWHPATSKPRPHCCTSNGGHIIWLKSRAPKVMIFTILYN